MSEEAGNYTGYRFSDFAVTWNECVDPLGSSKPNKMDVYLQESYKKQREGKYRIQDLDSTVIYRLCDNHTDMDHNQIFGSESTLVVAVVVATSYAESASFIRNNSCR